MKPDPYTHFIDETTEAESDCLKANFAASAQRLRALADWRDVEQKRLDESL